ncbi:hypothetical protein [Enterococcus faecium]|uniref:hypothetical protein n=1 Tax=Enterococcus faecium TaxID=1352 RepID=UPI003F443BCB
MDLITQYSDIILKKIMMKIQKDKKSKERAELVKLEMAETGSGVRTSRHLKDMAAPVLIDRFNVTDSVVENHLKEFRSSINDTFRLGS